MEISQIFFYFLFTIVAIICLYKYRIVFLKYQNFKHTVFQNMKCLANIRKILTTIKKYNLDADNNTLVNEFRQVYRLINQENSEQTELQKVKPSLREEQRYQLDQMTVKQLIKLRAIQFFKKYHFILNIFLFKKVVSRDILLFNLQHYLVAYYFLIQIIILLRQFDIYKDEFRNKQTQLLLQTYLFNFLFCGLSITTGFILMKLMNKNQIVKQFDQIFDNFEEQQLETIPENTFELEDQTDNEQLEEMIKMFMVDAIIFGIIIFFFFVLFAGCYTIKITKSLKDQHNLVNFIVVILFLDTLNRFIMCLIIFLVDLGIQHVKSRSNLKKEMIRRLIEKSKEQQINQFLQNSSQRVQDCLDITILLIEKTKKKVNDLGEFESMMKDQHNIKIGENQYNSLQGLQMMDIIEQKSNNTNVDQQTDSCQQYQQQQYQQQHQQQQLDVGKQWNIVELDMEIVNMKEQKLNLIHYTSIKNDEMMFYYRELQLMLHRYINMPKSEHKQHQQKKGDYDSFNIEMDENNQLHEIKQMNYMKEKMDVNSFTSKQSDDKDIIKKKKVNYSFVNAEKLINNQKDEQTNESQEVYEQKSSVLEKVQIKKEKYGFDIDSIEKDNNTRESSRFIVEVQYESVDRDSFRKDNYQDDLEYKDPANEIVRIRNQNCKR